MRRLSSGLDACETRGSRGGPAPHHPVGEDAFVSVLLGVSVLVGVGLADSVGVGELV